MQQKLQTLEHEALHAITQAHTLKELENIDIKYLGRKGELTTILRELKNIPAEERPAMGQKTNTVKTKVQNALDEKRTTLQKQDLQKQLTETFIDVTAPGEKKERGHIHPLSLVQREVEEIFQQMGFTIADGPEVESEYYNFEALNIPAHHPARDMQDTFFVDQKPDEKHGRLVLRTHTSPVQIRTMEKNGAPLRIIVPGRVFRFEATDASHEHTFYQVEGMLIDKEIGIAHLKGVMTTFLSRLFKKDIVVRFRPGYFPFVEPGLEVDFSCLLCDAKGCRVCKNSGWIEFMGAGMVHANVLRAGGIDPAQYQGWAFGFGLTRLVMMRYGITDIRLLLGNDVRFLSQF